MRRFFIFFLLSLSLQACGKSKHLQIGTGSQIDVLTSSQRFYEDALPAGWVIKGADRDDLFSTEDNLANIYMVPQGVHIQSGDEDFILARYLQAKMLVSPYLSWKWNISEHKNEDHPVSLIIGFYGGDAKSEPLKAGQLIWRGENLPPFDRVLSIGYNDMALRRGNLYSKGKLKYYVQRGGIEQTNQWHDEIVDLSLIYRRAWPNDRMANVVVTFIGMSAKSTATSGGMTFSKIRISR